MIADFVADASVAIAWAVVSQSSAGADRILDRVIKGATIFVPPIWFYETANTLLILQRRAKISQAEYRAGRELLEGLRMFTDDEALGLVSTQVADLAIANGLTVYDAAYLDLSMRKSIPLASRDARLNTVAKRCGIPVLLQPAD
ncbi:MAG TPA: type II toxin-antitoxin system VapC family toxin [Bryobacteraceae bacterium]|nr:type II toxin-antitoxin system VapC family toxin [Bryobacteraceae bacterium]